MTQTWEEITAEIRTHCEDEEWQHARLAAMHAVDTGEYWWPEGEGLGSSDVNHIAVGLYTSGRLVSLLQELEVLARLAHWRRLSASLVAETPLAGSPA